MTNLFDIDKHTIFLGLTGSHAYGMARPDSDVDIRGVCIPPRRIRDSHYQSFKQWTPKSQVGAWGPNAEKAIENLAKHPTAGPCYERDGQDADLVIYSVHKFINHCAENNPSFLEILFLPEEAQIYTTPQWEILQANRKMFLSLEARARYVGYAMGQLDRIRSHRAWLLNPPKKEPTREDYGLPGETVIPADVRNQIDEAAQKIIRAWGVEDGLDQYIKGAPQDMLRKRMVQFQATVMRCEEALVDEKIYKLAAASIGLSKDALFAIKQERRYRAARKNWEQYQKWKKDRNAARAELEAKFGYDSKHASHLIRLLRTGLELMRDEELRVWRGDAEELMAIRRGKLTYDELMESANNLKAEIVEAVKTCSFEKSPDREKIDNLLFTILD